LSDDVKKPMWKKWWFWGIVFIILYGIGLAGGNKPATESTTAPSATPTVTQTATQTTTQQSAPAPAAKTWQQIIAFEGSSTKNTQTFHVTSNEWRINWSTQPGQYGDMNFQIMVYKGENNLVSVAANVIGKGADTSYMRGSGDYYLMINTAQPYKITIEENK
jgi:hypothetical protein